MVAVDERKMRVVGAELAFDVVWSPPVMWVVAVMEFHVERGKQELA